jgi:hypothetical protein
MGKRAKPPLKVRWARWLARAPSGPVRAPLARQKAALARQRAWQKHGPDIFEGLFRNCECLCLLLSEKALVGKWWGKVRAQQGCGAWLKPVIPISVRYHSLSRFACCPLYPRS